MYCGYNYNSKLNTYLGPSRLTEICFFSVLHSLLVRGLGQFVLILDIAQVDFFYVTERILARFHFQ